VLHHTTLEGKSKKQTKLASIICCNASVGPVLSNISFNFVVLLV